VLWICCMGWVGHRSSKELNLGRNICL